MATVEERALGVLAPLTVTTAMSVRDLAEILKRLSDAELLGNDAMAGTVEREIEFRERVARQVLGWIDDAPEHTPGLDLLRQIVTPVPKGNGQ